MLTLELTAEELLLIRQGLSLLGLDSPSDLEAARNLYDKITLLYIRGEQ